MKIVVYEHFTSGALSGQDLPVELANEGNAMLHAIVSDMYANTAFEPIILRDERLPNLLGAHNLSIGTRAQYQKIWEKCLHSETLFLLIAPETDGILQQLAEAVISSGKILVGSSTEAIAICSNKLRCSQFLHQNNLPTIATQTAEGWLKDPAFNRPLVCKPNYGAGCVDTYFFADAEAARAYLQQLPLELRQQQIVQPFITAQAMSFSLFIDQRAQILSLNQQIIGFDQQLSYKGSNIFVSYPQIFSQAQGQVLINQLLMAMPGLSGFVGIDILIDEQAVWIVDINPRLTSSFNQLQSKGLSPATLLHQSLSQKVKGIACG